MSHAKPRRGTKEQPERQGLIDFYLAVSSRLCVRQDFYAKSPCSKDR
jgi:hypothetical protein